MEASPKIKSHSDFLQLTNMEQLNTFVTILEKCFNNPNKYDLREKDIKIDQLGDPYVFSRYLEKTEYQERLKLKGKFYGEIINLRSDLNSFDSLCEDHLENKLKILFLEDYVTKDKLNPLYYRIVIYIKPMNGFIIEDGMLTKVKPVTV